MRKIESNLNSNIKLKNGDLMVGKRSMFILSAFLAGIWFLSGIFVIVLSYLVRESYSVRETVSTKFVLLSGVSGLILMFLGIAFLWNSLRKIQ